MLGLDGHELTGDEKEILGHPLIGGVILFSRNYHSIEQLAALVESIHDLRQPRLLVAVDQEGGRVQRFRGEFTRLPAVRRLGEIYDNDPGRARQLARTTGWLMAAELRAVGVDFSFAPVLDLDWGLSGIIGDRAFHRRPEIVGELACAYMGGMQKAGMEAVGKHFPGHGGVTADSHLELPIDNRSYNDLADGDLAVFERLVRGGIAAIMTAHVVYPQVDSGPSSFSPVWLRDILRGRLGFQGAIFSDDLEMLGAAFAGDPAERAKAALLAGCDMVLACNDRASGVAILDGLNHPVDPVPHLRLVRMHGRGHLNVKNLHLSETWKQAERLVRDYDAFPLLDLDI